MPPRAPSRRYRLWFWFLLGALVLTGVTFFASRAIGIAEVRAAAAAVLLFAERQPVLVFLLLVVAHAAGMALSLPTKGVLNLVAGALLQPLAGTLATLVGVLGGTTVLFFLVRGLLRERFEEAAGPFVERLERRLNRHPIPAVAGLRLIITLPYGPITIAAALAGVRFWPFLIGSLLGDLPVVILYSVAGSHLAALTSLAEVLTPGTAVILSITGLTLVLSALSFDGRRKNR